MDSLQKLVNLLNEFRHKTKNRSNCSAASTESSISVFFLFKKKTN